MFKCGFDNDKYLKLQSEKIRERIALFGERLYLEFGGKLFDDFHASRVLPGFAPDSKIKMLIELKDVAEIIISINTADIEKNKVRGDLGITYDLDVLRLIDAFRGYGLYVGSVVMTRYKSNPTADAFKQKLEKLGIKVYKHYAIDGYPHNIPHIVSDEGYGKNEYAETTRSLVVVTAPGPGSGKMATCLSQIYHESKMGRKSGYAKFETFPIWNIPLNHPVNLAYEAATADLADVNMIDPFHLEAYGVTTVNYNRDVEVFPVLRSMLTGILGECPYKSPTDMGVNMAGFCIYDDEAVCEAAKQEIIRRHYNALCNMRKGSDNEVEIQKIEILLRKLSSNPEEDRRCVAAANAKAEETGAPAVAIELNDGRIVTGKTSSLLGASSAALLNALKVLAGIDKETDLISPEILEPIQKLKVENLGNHNPRLHTDEVLIALSISAVNNPASKRAFDAISGLKYAEVHSSVILSQVDAATFRKLGVNLSCEPKYQTKKLYHKN
ncbi:MAG: DUF1846 domain-containing protein [Clostridia bacterium]|nr:DUF1846 domain-containing protein [Clostridia bacterium]MBO5206503.1 DUF1846 domain-containing protein [Clostridia bacterium]